MANLDINLLQDATFKKFEKFKKLVQGDVTTDDVWVTYTENYMTSLSITRSSLAIGYVRIRKTKNASSIS